MPLEDEGLLPRWFARERHMAALLPYVSLVDDTTIRTRGNALMQCIRLDGLNSYTTEDALLDKTRALFAHIVAQSGADYAFYVHKVSRPVAHDLPAVTEGDFAQAVDARWRAHLDGGRLRDKSLTLTVLRRPTLGAKVPLRRAASMATLRAETTKALRRLNEVTSFLRSTFAPLNARLLSAQTGELLGFLGALNTGRESPIHRGSSYGYVAQDVANTRVTFKGPNFHLSEGPLGRRVGTTYALKSYHSTSHCTMFDELNLPVDMVVTQSFSAINSNLMSGRIKRQMRLRRAADDGALSLMEEMPTALDDLETGRLSFGLHHMTATVFAETEGELDSIGAELRNIASSQGITMVNESFAAKTHYFAQHPGNGAKRSRKATVTNHNFADYAAFHRPQMGKTGDRVPWGVPVTLFPTVDRGGFRFNFHEEGRPDKEPTGGHTLILGRPGSGKSVLAAFLMTQAKRAGARLFVFDYRRGMEMAVRANGGRYTSIHAGERTGLNPLRTETDARGQAWLADWLSALIHRPDRPLAPTQVNRIQEIVRQNAQAREDLRNWTDLASLFSSTDDEGDLHERLVEWTEGGRYGWIFGTNQEDSFSLAGETVGFDLTGVLDSESDKERMAVLSYLFRRVERQIEDRRRTIIIIDEAWKALDNPYFAERLSNWLVTARKQNAVVVMMTQYVSQLKRTTVGQTIVEAVPTQILLPNIRARRGDYDLLGLQEKELDVLLNSGSTSRLGLVRDDQGAVLIDADLSPLGDLLTVLGGMDKGEALVGADYRTRPDFWRI
ncbi:type IV secretion system protein B4 [Limimaricola sp. AA108-03]|uniref:VirB4 family type IV secretion/conjugal transfer ATPase n=1 Tax=Limimaricola sp. AA108-03 TaxID=3425945 RepID=UPI003D789399